MTTVYSYPKYAPILYLQFFSFEKLPGQYLKKKITIKKKLNY